MDYRAKLSRGFTLIELSIVLVIIGLLTGGILVGRDLIEGAEIRKTISQIDKFETAANSFKLKYDCLPGDCANAVALGLGTAGGMGDNGNGNGTIDYSIYYGSEQTNFWYHLQQANLVTDVVQLNDFPCGGGGNASNPAIVPTGGYCLYGNIPNGGKVAVSSYASYGPPITHGPNWFFIGNIASWMQTLDCQGNVNGDLDPANAGPCAWLSPYEAYAIDSKIDDGLPFTGKVHAHSGNYGGSGTDGYSLDYGEPTNIGFGGPYGYVDYSDSNLPSGGTTPSGEAACVTGPNPHTGGWTAYFSSTYNVTHSNPGACSLSVLTSF